MPRQRTRSVAAEARLCEQWNRTHPIGKPVRYWTGAREGEGKTSRTRTKAQLVCEHAVVWLEDEAACVALSHVEPINEIIET